MRNSSGVEQFYLVDETVGKELIDKLHCPCRLVVDDIYMGEEGMEYAVLYRPETLFGEHEDVNYPHLRCRAEVGAFAAPAHSQCHS